MSKYELAVLYHPDLEIDLEKSSQKIQKLITDNKGVITGEDNWGKRKMAYKIKGHDHALYVFYTFEMSEDNLRKVETTLNITDEVIRFLITKVDQKAVDKAEKFKADKAKKAKKREESSEKTEQTSEVKEVKEVAEG